MNSYDLSRNFWNWAFDNPEKISPNHAAVYFFAIEHCNRLGWKEKFGLPTTMAKEAIGIKSYNTYINTLHDLVEWKFIKMIETSKNQYSANIVALSNFNKALNNALDKALIKHASKQSESTSESIGSIDKQVTSNKKQINKEQSFETFWNLYNKKTDRPKCEAKWSKLTTKDREYILKYVPKYVESTPEVQFRKNPYTFLNNRSWENEIIEYTGNESELGIPSRPNPKYLEGKNIQQKKAAWAVWRDNGFVFLGEHKGWVEKAIVGTDKIGQENE